MNELDLFADAIAIANPNDRSAFLDRKCIGRPDLRQRLAQLLEAHANSQAMLDRPQRDPDATVAHETNAAHIGSIIAGRYKLLEQIGDGGMGTVWMAEQQKPVKRLVAVKLIKAGMDSKAVLARFDAERQALALMDHPNIAKVLDGGTTPSFSPPYQGGDGGGGYPYFVMELVKGLPLTEYCDTRKLSVNERLDLFVQICSAVQHAHQKAVIHRDLKPSNVLVTEHDGKPVPKVIDFGLAKALSSSNMLTERTLHTAYGAVVGTPLYMAPELVGINALDVDTRADIYALGVILYELLTGTTPLEKARFKEVAWDEIKRVIREEEPPKPSTRLSSNKTLASLAATRQVEPAQLQRLVRGELDWIVMKALDKDRARRYETANGLAKDVQRYLAGDTVEACPPTLGYRLRKAFQRNRAAVLIGSAIAAILLLATAISVAFGLMARQSEKRATIKEQDAFRNARQAEQHADEREKAITYLSRVLAKFNPYRYPDGTPPVSVILEEASRSLDQQADSSTQTDTLPPIVQAKVRSVFGRMLLDIHQYVQGQQLLKTAYEELKALRGQDDLDTLAALEAYANSLVEGRSNQAHLKTAEKLLNEVHKARSVIQGAGHPDTIHTLSKSLCNALFYQMDFIGAKECQEKALAQALANPTLSENHEFLATRRLGLANMLKRSPETRDRDEARRLCQLAIQTFSEKHGPNHPITLDARMQLVTVNDETTEVNELYEQLDAVARQMNPELAARNREYAIRIYDDLALFSLTFGKPELAAEATEQLLMLGPLEHGKGHPFMRRYNGFRAWYLIQVGRFAEAEAQARQIFSPLFSELERLEGGWDDFPKSLGNAALAKCILQKNNLLEDDFKKAEQYLKTPVASTQTAARRLGGLNRREKLLMAHGYRLWIELYEKWNKPQLAAPFKKQLAELFK